MASSSPRIKPDGALEPLPVVLPAASARRLTSRASRETRESATDATRDSLDDRTFYSTLNIDMKQQVSAGNVRVLLCACAVSEYGI
jgi:hypothetical protein